MGIPTRIDPNKNPHELYEAVDYKLFWSGLQQHQLDRAEHAVLRELLPVSGSRLIDIGCGYGRLSDCYLDRFDQIVMFDGSMSLLRQARDKTEGRAIYVAGDLHHLPFKNASFYSVVMVRVFHHIKDSGACLSELHRLIAGNGCLIMTYRNKMYPVQVLKWFAHPTSVSPFSLKPSEIGETLLSHHPTYVKRLLIQTGFTDFQYRGLGVLDRLAKFGFSRKYTPSGEFLAPFFGKLLIAPWIFCRAYVKQSNPLLEDGKIEDLLMCVVCSGNLRNDVDGFTCFSCGKHYPISDGIIDFRLY